MNLSKPKLLEAMKQCLPGVEKGSSLIEGADAFRFSGGFVQTYNNLIAVSVPMDLDGLECAVKAMDFFKLVSKLNAPLIAGELVGNKLKLKAGRTKAQISTMATQTEDYIKALNLGGITFKAVPGNFAEALKLCKMSCNPTPYRGIYVSGKDLLSTDQARINHFTLDAEMDTFWLDDPAVSEFMKLGKAVEYCLDGSWLHLKLENGTIFSAKIKDHSQFPKDVLVGHVDALKNPEGGHANRLPKSLSEAVGRVATMASGEGNTSQLIRLTLKDKELELFAEKPGGSVEDGVEWEKPFDEGFQPIQLWVEAAFLLEASKKVMDFHIGSADGAQALIFTAPGYVQMASTNDPNG